MKKFFTLFAAAFLFTATARADVQSYTQGLINSAIVDVFKDGTTIDQRIPPFRKVVGEHFNFDYIANFILGVHSRGLSLADKKDFIEAFTELNVQSYARKFANYTNMPVIVDHVSPGQKDGEYFVDSKVKSEDEAGRDYEIVWRVMQMGDGYKVIDIVVEGVSMAMSYRNEYAQVLKEAASEGKPPVPALTAKIRERIAGLKS